MSGLNRVAGELGKVAPVSLRVNPDVDAKTHPYIATGLKENKFGVAYRRRAAALSRGAAHGHICASTGIDCHIGSQLTEIAPFIAALQKVLVWSIDWRPRASRIDAHRSRRRPGNPLSG